MGWLAEQVCQHERLGKCEKIHCVMNCCVNLIFTKKKKTNQKDIFISPSALALRGHGRAC